MNINKLTYPMLFKAMVQVTNEGAPETVIFADNHEFGVRENRTEGDLNLAECSLKELSEEQFDDFCTGEDEIIKPMLAGNLGLRIADALLDDHFNGVL